MCFFNVSLNRASTISESHTHMLCVHLLNNLSDVFVSELSLFIKKRGYFDDNSGDSSSAPPPSKLDAPLALEKFGCNTCTSIFLEPTHHCLNSWEKNMPGIYMHITSPIFRVATPFFQFLLFGKQSTTKKNYCFVM